jgi:hypothetical protein
MPIVTQELIYPTQVEMSEIDQDFLSVLTMSNPIFKLFPPRNVDSALVMWEQRYNYLGIMQSRGLEGQYPAVPAVGRKRYQLQPGHYGEVARIYGKEIEERRGSNSFTTPINVKDLVVERQEQTATRMYNLMAWLLWTLVTTGYYYAFDRNGTVEAREAIATQTYNFTVNLSNPSTAKPLFELRSIKLLHRGTSATFGGTAELWMNTYTWNQFIANANTADLGGRRSAGLETVEGIDQYNQFIAMKDNLPKVVEYDEGYYDNAGTFHTWIPDGMMVLIGRRLNGAPIGDFALTRNADNGNSSAPLVKVVTKGLEANQAPPMEIGVYRGFNGGPRFHYPNAIVVINANPN